MVTVIIFIIVFLSLACCAVVCVLIARNSDSAESASSFAALQSGFRFITEAIESVFSSIAASAPTTVGGLSGDGRSPSGRGSELDDPHDDRQGLILGGAGHGRGTGDRAKMFQEDPAAGVDLEMVQGGNPFPRQSAKVADMNA